MSADVAILSAVYDGYDSVKPVLEQAGLEVDWVLVTDHEPADARGWRVVVEPQPDVPPRRAAKAPKFEPWKYTDAPASIWVDASFRVTSPGFAAAVMEHAKPIAQFEHPWRDCLYDEAAEITKLGMDPDGVAAWQTRRYREAGHPERWGLWASGVIARKHTAAVKRMGAAWAREVASGSARDQVSQPHVLREARLRPTTLPGTHFTNAWLAYEGSGRH
ncbi:DUF616 domain-containing protein [Streptomyces sp. 549]|uniref:glycosyltransferase domain-containing protein n=1 Tax=Streptomyces sp. 549 TaxID=3049076 RepID=UPI0024C28675|nr:glycosyltransferase domain-containing protein [Streptomyces sp. 549]MDK1473597.1 DUF616 domain-containing protein [Streptomyces sp. 549]